MIVIADMEALGSLAEELMLTLPFCTLPFVGELIVTLGGASGAVVVTDTLAD
jgi:hypothetical protein